MAAPRLSLTLDLLRRHAPYARSEVHLSEIMENMCSKFKDYADVGGDVQRINKRPVGLLFPHLDTHAVAPTPRQPPEGRALGLCVRTRVCIYVRIYVCIYVCVYVCVCVCIRAHVRARARCVCVCVCVSRTFWVYTAPAFCACVVPAPREKKAR